MDSGGLMVGGGFAAAQLSLALWLTHLFLMLLRSSKPALSWHMLLAALTMVASTFAWQSNLLLLNMRWVWLGSSVLAAVMLIVNVGRWLGNSAAKTSSLGAGTFIPLTIAITGSLLALAALSQEQAQHIKSAMPRWSSILYLITVAIMFGVTLAASLELTAGETGKELLRLPWQHFTLATGIAFLIQIGLGLLVVAKLKAGPTPIETMAPVIYCFGMLLLSYIAWCIPRRMLAMAKQSTVTGQATLALSGWIGLLCFILASTLPVYWPWNTL